MDILNNIVKTSEQRAFVDDVVSTLNNKNEIIMFYNNQEFVVDPHGKFIQVYSKGSVIAYYSDAFEFLTKHTINDKTVIELSSEIDYSI